MHKVRQDRPLDPGTLAVLTRLQFIATSRQLDYLIIGATARDLMMTHVFGINAGRATRDVDLAIALESWDEFATVKQAFIDSGDFSAGGQPHRLYFREQAFGMAYPVDLIPFGPIEHTDKVIAWPPDMQVVMNVAGYREAMQTAVTLEVGNGVVAKVVSLPALAALKLFAWQDRGLADPKDASDFYFLIRNYYNAGNAERIYGDAAVLLDENDFDPDLAGAALLGYDLARILDASSNQAVQRILADTSQCDRLLVHIGRNIDPVVAVRFLDQFASGLRMADIPPL